jgi:hypothetical protein
VCWAQVLIIITIVGASFLWSNWGLDGRFWRNFMFWADWGVLILVGAGLLGRLLLPEFNGLTQRLSYLGFYLWLLVIGADHIELNGWIFPYKRMNRGFLQWLQGTLITSAKSTPDASHRQWIDEVFETFQRRIGGEF